MRGRRLAVAGAALAAGLGAVGLAAMRDRGPGAPTAPPGPPVSFRPWLDAARPPEERLGALLAALTLEEKVSLLHGADTKGHTKSAGWIPGVARLGVPEAVFSDGPAGVRDSSRGGTPRPSTALPAPIALAATFDRGLAGRYGEALGREARAKGVDVLYAPAVNLVRVPQGGRNFEYLGEDPFLAGSLVVPEVQGIQSQGVAAQVKHFAANNQERDRHTTSSDVEPRPLRELYLPAFRSAVTEGGAWSLMCANNKVNGVHACQNGPLLRGILRDEWGFDGVVGSDYNATHSAAASLRAGLDQSFHSRDWGKYYRDLPGLVRRGEVGPGEVDAAARRVLRLLLRVGLLDGRPRTVEPVDREAHARVAREVAEAGTVLLKNAGGLLPLDAGALRSVAVVGPWAEEAYTGGGGSSRVTPGRSVSPVQGLRARLGPGVEVVSASGADRAEASRLAGGADVAIVVVGDEGRESRDREDLSLDGGGDALVSAVAAANPRTVVVLDIPGPVTMPWLGDVGAVLAAWYPGQEAGRALARLLVGDVSPSGKLPVTFPRRAADAPTAGAPRYPARGGAYRYSEGLRVGYRWYDEEGIAPLFAFGAGLAYTTFELSGLAVVPGEAGGLDVSFRVANSGGRPGTETPQVYVESRAPGASPRALAGFTKVALGPGEDRAVTVAVPGSALERWDSGRGAWQADPGPFVVSVSTSSERNSQMLSSAFVR